jgi:ATP-dependent helicase/nuclease subunit A
MDTPHPSPGKLTPSQERAVTARGNVLVMAGAGTGKTKTLVDRCLHCLEFGGASIEELLIVTFTEAAAAEMRDRLRQAIQERVSEKTGLFTDRWTEQLARFDLAHIGTLHGFCLKLVREHFYDLELDPRLTLLDEGEARQLANQVLTEQFDVHYAGEDPFSLAVQELIQVHGGGRDESIRLLVARLHLHSQAQPEAAGWLARQRGIFATAEPTDWQAWLLQGMQTWRNDWLPLLKLHAGGNEKAAELAGLLECLDAGQRVAAAGTIDRMVAADGNWPKGRKTVLRKPLEDLFAETQFLQSLLVPTGGHDPLAEDWSWVRGQMQTLLQLAEQFAARLAERKRANGALDFQDLEQFALKLLWDSATSRPTAVAGHWRQKLKFVFVDEYQDINAAQDKIIQGLSRDGDHANRFLVGDVKQSIYRFRLADPKIFREYARSWREPAGQTIPLRENFRSAEGLLRLANSIFHQVMREEVGGVAYDAEAALNFGAPDTRTELSAARDLAPRAKLLLRFKRRRAASRDEDAAVTLDETQSEARMVVRELQHLVGGGQLIFDAKQNAQRPVEWRDIAILLRSPRGRSEVYAKECERAGIPLQVARGGFYESAEVLDLLSLLQLLDNPLQDVPCLAVLRSPLVGLSLDELAEIRHAARGRHFWTALNRSAEVGLSRPETQAKIDAFRQRFSRWRRLSRLGSLSQCLEEILAETLYADWLRGQPRGPERVAGVTAFLQLAQRFDQLQRQGLYRFLQFIEAQQEAGAEPEVPPTIAENAVRLMSIHQSKGLEFPVVVLADLAKSFNEQDLRGDIIFDEELGVCPKVKPPGQGRRYPSLPHWLAQRRQKRELRGEELRLFYVALTRARDRLILAASLSEKSWEEKWTRPQAMAPHQIAAAKSVADWLALWFAHQLPTDADMVDHHRGQLADLHWQIIPDEPASGEDPPKTESRNEEPLNQSKPEAVKLADGGNDVSLSQGERAGVRAVFPPHHLRADEDDLNHLRERLEWIYPFTTATRHKAKSSVTALRRQAEEMESGEMNELFPDRSPIASSRQPARATAKPLGASKSSPGGGEDLGEGGLPPHHGDQEEEIGSPPTPARRSDRSAGKTRLGAAEIGLAHHKFLQHLALDKAGDLAVEAERLVREHYLTAEERAALDLKALAAFWSSAIGQKILAHADEVRRELPFTARFSPVELAAITGAPADPALAEEFVIVQGVADLVVLRPEEIWLLDFKTDDITARDLPEKIRIYTPQLRLYAAALERIFQRRVTGQALHFLALGRTEEGV